MDCECGNPCRPSWRQLRVMLSHLTQVIFQTVQTLKSHHEQNSKSKKIKQCYTSKTRRKKSGRNVSSLFSVSLLVHTARLDSTHGVFFLKKKKHGACRQEEKRVDKKRSVVWGLAWSVRCLVFGVVWFGLVWSFGVGGVGWGGVGG